MPIKTVETFEVQFLQILDENGKCDAKLMPKLSNDDIKTLYETIVLARVFDEKCINLQRQGRMGTYASVLGQEAAQIGSAFVLERQDWLIPSFRESAALIMRNSPLVNIMQYWAGDERGHNLPRGINNFPIAIPVGTQPLHAVGIAWASLLKKEKAVALAYVGDGGTSEGDFHEALNFAGVFKIPCVFIVQNNQWAISVPRKLQTAAETIAQKAIAYGFDGIQVDGNDIFAMIKATQDAVAKARAGKGPTLIEAYTYRMGNHTTADEASRYRDDKEKEAWQKKDPLDRLKKYMQQQKIGDEAYEKRVQEKAKNQVEEAVKDLESLPLPKPEDMFDNTYKELTDQLKEQKEYLQDILREKEQHG